MSLNSFKGQSFSDPTEFIEFRQIDKMTRATAVRSAKMIVRDEGGFGDLSDFIHSPALVQRVMLRPDFIDFGFLKEIVDVPEELFIPSQMTVDSFS
jgi:hypothetical protein